MHDISNLTPSVSVVVLGHVIPSIIIPQDDPIVAIN